MNPQNLFPEGTVADDVEPLPLRSDMARYAVLASPEEVAELNEPNPLFPALEGWTIVSELLGAEVDQLANAGNSDLRLSVHEFEQGLPALVMSVRTEGFECRWVMSMWERDARAWLDDVLARGSVSIVIAGTDVPRCILLKLFNEDVWAAAPNLHAQVEPRRAPVGDEHLFYMVDAGLQAACLPPVQVEGTTKTSLTELRILAVGRGDHAADLYATLSRASEFALLLSSRYPQFNTGESRSQG